MLGEFVSEASPPLDRICRLVTGRLAETSGIALSDPETASGVPIFTFAVEKVLRDARDVFDILIEAGSVGLADPGRWVDNLPRKPQSTSGMALLSGHLWSRDGKSKRNAATLCE